METGGDAGDLVPASTDSHGSSDEDRRTGLEGHYDVPDTVTPTDTDTAHNMKPGLSVAHSKQTHTLNYYRYSLCTLLSAK